MRDLFLGTGIAHTILLFAVVIALGLYLGRFKFKGISIGSTWILFIGILLSHFGFRGDPHKLMRWLKMPQLPLPVSLRLQSLRLTMSAGRHRVQGCW